MLTSKDRTNSGATEVKQVHKSRSSLQLYVALSVAKNDVETGQEKGTFWSKKLVLQMDGFLVKVAIQLEPVNASTAVF